MGSHFYGWIDYNGVAFLLESLEWDHIFGIWEIRKFRWLGILKWEDFCFIKFNQCVHSIENDLFNVKRLYKVDA